MSGFFGAGVFSASEVILGNLLGKGGFFGPILRAAASVPVGNQVVFSIVAAANSLGPYVTPPNPNNSYEFGASTAGTGSINGGVPVAVNGAQVLLLGQFFNGNDGTHWNCLSLAGNLAQNFFINMTFDDGTGFLYNLTSAAAGFNVPFFDPTLSFTTWNWPVPVGHAFAPLNLPYTINW